MVNHEILGDGRAAKWRLGVHAEVAVLTLAALLLADVLGEEKDGVSAAEAILKAIRAKAAKGDVRAAEVILDRAYGKPKQAVDIDANVNAQFAVVERRIVRPDGM